MPQQTPEYVWQKERRRTDISFDGFQPVRGFGPQGGYTLWLISPIVTRRYSFIDGKPNVKETGASVIDELTKLRNSTLAELNQSHRDGKVFIKADATMMNYAAEVIRRSYIVNDDDLTFLLCEAFQWYEPMVVHLLGGEQSRNALASVTPLMKAPVITDDEFTIAGVDAGEAGGAGYAIGDDLPENPAVTLE